MTSNRLLLLFSGILFTFQLLSQEILTGVQRNEEVFNFYIKKKEIELRQNFNSLNAESLKLPFFDGFETSHIYPNQNLWVGQSVYVNENFPYFPPSINAATFDALDSTGNIYAYANWIPFAADTLASRPIRLDSVFSPVKKALSPDDSLYLSFYYQPQGYGNAPEVWDSLLLEFSSVGEVVFQKIDSVWVFGYEYLSSEQDTLRPGDTVWPPSGCNPDIYTIIYEQISYFDEFQVACDSIFGPSTDWNRVWYSNGMKLDTFQLKNGGKNFVQVMIPITNTIYFYDKFQFRFRNYASLANDIIPSWRSNADIWNVDFVYLNYNRSAADTTYRTLTFSDRAPSFLKRYQSMPYRQYRADAAINTMRLDFPMYISNLDNIEHNTKYEYSVRQVEGTFGYHYNGGNCNLPPFYLSGFQSCINCQKHACPPVQSAFNYDFSRDTTSYIITHYISDSSDANILVDSAKYTQGFYNYFAYDDGTPEYGYGLEPAGAQLAYQFKLSVADTLRGVQMYFNHVQEQANENYFNLIIWKDNNGVPGEVAYVLQSQKPQWKEGLYHFYTYHFDTPLILSGTFYVGWQQLAFGSLNIGFDANNDNKDKIFYKIEQSWFNSNFSGSLLIRPIVGQDIVLGNDNESVETNNQKVIFYPNPASNYFSFSPDIIRPFTSVTIEIYTVYGTLVYRNEVYTSRINAENLSPGLYIVRLRNENRVFSGKLIIQH